MSVTIRYSVGLRPDYPPGLILPQADGEIYLPLQKGIQIARVMDQTNGTLTQNLAGIYPVQNIWVLQIKLVVRKVFGLKWLSGIPLA